MDTLVSSTEKVEAVAVIGSTEYPVNFTQDGNLYVGVPIGISLGGQVQNSADFLTFLEPNGTYDWHLNSIANTKVEDKSNQNAVGTGFTASPASGSISVGGKPAIIVINFVEVEYAITFVESMLPAGSPWSISMNITTLSTTGNSLTIYKPNYTSYMLT
ncbi:MAG: hypothetical protein ACYC7D_15960 [Nitrososphaerales archaeon]